MKNIFFFLLAILVFSGCKKSSIKQNCCIEPPSVYEFEDGSGIIAVPNIFTPDGDGINDSFAPIITFYENYSMKISDPKGNTIYETENSEPWDGTSDGNRVRDIVGWEITVKTTKANFVEYRGQVCALVKGDDICPKNLDQCFFANQYSNGTFTHDRDSKEMLCIE